MKIGKKLFQISMLCIIFLGLMVLSIPNSTYAMLGGLGGFNSDSYEEQVKADKSNNINNDSDLEKVVEEHNAVNQQVRQRMQEEPEVFVEDKFSDVPEEERIELYRKLDKKFEEIDFDYDDNGEVTMEGPGNWDLESLKKSFEDVNNLSDAVKKFASEMKDMLLNDFPETFNAIQSEQSDKLNFDSERVLTDLIEERMGKSQRVYLDSLFNLGIAVENKVVNELNKSTIESSGGVKFKLNGTEAVKLEGTHNLKLAMKLVGKYNKYLDSKVEVVVIDESENSSAGYINAIFGGRSRKITLNPDMAFSSEQSLQDVITHEMAHHIGFQMEDKKPGKWKQWEKLFNKAKDSEVLGVFKEELFNGIEGCGHPKDNADELFASTFNALENYQGELDKIMNNLVWGEPEKKRIAKEVINFVRDIQRNY